MDITKTIFQNKKKNRVEKKEMTNKNPYKKCPLRMSGSVIQFACRFCQKTLSKKEVELHLYMCEKVPQEIFD